MMYKVTFICAIALFELFKGSGSFEMNYGNMKISNIKVGDESNRTLRAWVEMLNVPTDNQQLELKLYMTEPLGNDNFYICQALKGTTKLRKIAEIKGKGMCNILNKLGMGVYWEIAALVGIKNPKECPVPKANYHLKPYILNYGKIPVVGLLPKGSYKVNCELLTPDKTKVKAWLSLDATKF